MATLLLAEHDNKSLKDATSKALTARSTTSYRARKRLRIVRQARRKQKKLQPVE